MVDMGSGLHGVGETRALACSSAGTVYKLNGIGGVQAGAGEVRKGEFEGNPWVGGGDAKIVPPAWLGRLPLDGRVESSCHFGNLQFVMGDHVTAQGEGDSIVLLIPQSFLFEMRQHLSELGSLSDPSADTHSQYRPCPILDHGLEEAASDSDDLDLRSIVEWAGNPQTHPAAVHSDMRSPDRTQ